MDEQRKNIKELLLTLTQKDFEQDVNLHIHSNFSDGKLSPEELVMDAKNKGYRLIAISDHNTVDAYKNTDLLNNDSVIPAIEFDCWYKGVLVHILGYGIDYRSTEFLDTLSTVKEYRKARNIRLYEKLQSMGIKIDLDPAAKGVGRVHFALAMVKAGYCQSVNEAFDRYLGTGKPAYIQATKLTPLAAVKAISEAGGIPCLAHPKAYLADKSAELIVSGLVKYGLKALEVSYPSHNETEEKTPPPPATKYRLIPTAGSDFHYESSDSYNASFVPKMDEADVMKLLKQNKTH